MKNIHWFTRRFETFFTAPIPVTPLGIFRVLIAGFLLLQTALWYPDWAAFMGSEGWVQWEISKAFNHSWHIHLQDIYVLIRHWGISDITFIYLFYGVYVFAGTGLLLGLFTRFWAILCWLCHYILMSSLPTFVYGVDIFLHISLFYLMWMPASKAFSLDLRLGWANAEPNWASTLAIRVLQIHLCLAYFSAGYEKMLYTNWWEGDVLWRAVIQPDFRQFDLYWLAEVPWLVVILSWFTMFIETFYFIGMWVPRLRVFWLLAMVGLHLGIGLFLGLYLFGLIMIVLSVSAFGYNAWQDVVAWRRNSSEFQTQMI